MNVVGAAIYLCATTLAYRLYADYRIVHVNAVLILHMLGDLIYLFDAYLYYDSWQYDRERYEANVERQQLIELQLGKQLNVARSAGSMTTDEYQ